MKRFSCNGLPLSNALVTYERNAVAPTSSHAGYFFGHCAQHNPVPMVDTSVWTAQEALSRHQGRGALRRIDSATLSIQEVIQCVAHILERCLELPALHSKKYTLLYHKDNCCFESQICAVNDDGTRRTLQRCRAGISEMSKAGIMAAFQRVASLWGVQTQELLLSKAEEALTDAVFVKAMTAQQQQQQQQQRFVLTTASSMCSDQQLNASEVKSNGLAQCNGWVVSPQDSAPSLGVNFLTLNDSSIQPQRSILSACQDAKLRHWDNGENNLPVTTLSERRMPQEGVRLEEQQQQQPQQQPNSFIMGPSLMCKSDISCVQKEETTDDSNALRWFASSSTDSRYPRFSSDVQPNVASLPFGASVTNTAGHCATTRWSSGPLLVSMRNPETLKDFTGRFPQDCSIPRRATTATTASSLWRPTTAETQSETLQNAAQMLSLHSLKMLEDEEGSGKGQLPCATNTFIDQQGLLCKPCTMMYDKIPTAAFNYTDNAYNTNMAVFQDKELQLVH